MLVLMVVVFLLGYTCIALEHQIKIDKSASALVLCGLLWTLYVFYAPDVLPQAAEFQKWASELVDKSGSVHEQALSFITTVQIVEHLGDVAQTLFYLIGAMTIVELVDIHGGFSIITDRITARNKKELMWIIACITFIMSAILDNLTTAIVMTMLLRKIVADQHERWIFAGVIIIAANAGGAWSPIGDVTTIMLWVRGMCSTEGLVPNLILPSLLAMAIPTFLASRMISGQLPQRVKEDHSPKAGESLLPSQILSAEERRRILVLGVAALVFVPIFKALTHLPPFIGVLLGLGFLWVYTELMYRRMKDVPESSKARVSAVLGRIDFSTILFFLGILMAVAVLQMSGILGMLSKWLEETLHDCYLIDFIIGMLSSVVDNVPLVAGCMGMYDIVPQAVADAAAQAGDPSMLPFVRDGVFWMFLAYCAGVGGSLLIIGSAAGVVVMGLEGINFVWYLKKFTLLAFSGYLCGAVVYVVQEMLLHPAIGL